MFLLSHFFLRLIGVKINQFNFLGFEFPYGDTPIWDFKFPGTTSKIQAVPNFFDHKWQFDSILSNRLITQISELEKFINSPYKYKRH